jgi:hypothetical protein
LRPPTPDQQLVTTGSYMDAPVLPSIFFDSGSQVEIAAIHSASVYGTWPRALMEYAD